MGFYESNDPTNDVKATARCKNLKFRTQYALIKATLPSLETSEFQ